MNFETLGADTYKTPRTPHQTFVAKAIVFSSRISFLKELRRNMMEIKERERERQSAERQTETDERDSWGGQKLNTQMLINPNRHIDDVEDKSQDYSVSVSLRGV